MIFFSIFFQSSFSNGKFLSFELYLFIKESICKCLLQNHVCSELYLVFEDGSHCGKSEWKICCQRDKEKYSYSYSKCGYYEGSTQLNC